MLALFSLSCSVCLSPFSLALKRSPYPLPQREKQPDLDDLFNRFNEVSETDTTPADTTQTETETPADSTQTKTETQAEADTTQIEPEETFLAVDDSFTVEVVFVVPLQPA